MQYLLYCTFLIASSNLVYQCSAQIKCYECTIVPPGLYTNKTTRLCSQFIEDSRFEVSCPYSTFCMKKTSELNLQDRIVRTEERSCAPQKKNYHELQNSRWITKTGIEEKVYQEGCFSAEQLGIKSSKVAEYCYCSTNLCNNGKPSTEMKFFHHTDTMSVIFIFNIVKLLRSTN